MIFCYQITEKKKTQSKLINRRKVLKAWLDRIFLDTP